MKYKSNAIRVCGGGGEYRLLSCRKPFNVCFMGKVQKCGVVRSTTGSHRNYPTSATKTTTLTASRSSLIHRHGKFEEKNKEQKQNQSGRGIILLKIPYRGTFIRGKKINNIIKNFIQFDVQQDIKINNITKNTVWQNLLTGVKK